MLLFIGQVNAQYCTPTFDDGCAGGDEINNFSIPSAGFSHLNTGCSTGAYGDYTSQTITLEIGTPYSFTVTHNFSSQYVRIWADFDNSQSFTDAAPELIAMGSSASVGGVNTTTGTINIPGTVTPGTYRMRLATRYSEQPVPCDNTGLFGAWGEVHDYTLIVTAPACWVPSAPTAGTPGLTTVSLSWTAASTAPAEGYEVYYSTSNTPPTPTTVLDATNSTTSMTPSADLTGLSSSSVYFAWVRSSCSATVKSAWVGPVSFTTTCGVLNVPYLQNFEGVTTPALPVCTSIENIGTGNNWRTATAGGDFNTKVLNYPYHSSNNANAWFYTPGINLTAGTSYRISYIYGNASGSTIYPEKMKVAYGTTASSTGMNIILADYPNIVNQTTAISADIDFIPASSGVYYFGFNAYSDADMNQLYVDNIKIDLSPTCFEPSALASSNVLSGSADLSWTAPSVIPANGYQVYYSVSNVAPTATTVLDASNSVTTLTTSATLNNLNSATTYYVWVRSDCGSGDKSQWTSSISLLTACVPVATLSENFDAYPTGSIVPTCWARIVPATDAGSQTITSTTPASGSRNIYQYASPTQNPVIVVLPEFSNVAAGTHWLKFKARVTTAPGALEVGFVTDPTDATTFVNLQTLDITNTSYNSSYYSVVIPNWIPANARLAVKNPSDDKSYYWDDVVWEQAPTCFPPTGVTLSGVLSDGVTASWTAPAVAPANGYEVYYSTSSTAPTASTVLDATNSVTSTGASASVTGLNPATTYYIWVRSVCSASDKSDWSMVSSFTTSCVLVTEFSENFNATAVNALPSCWAKLTTGASANAYVQASTAMSSPNALYVYGDSSSSNVYVTMPQVSTLSSGNYRLRFKARANFTAGGILEIGYMSNPTDHTTFTALGTYTSSSTTAIDNYSLNITGVPAGITTLALRHTGAPAYSILVDDVVYEPVPGCGDVTALTASNPTLNGADLMWTAPATAPAGGYEIYYSTSATPPTASTVLDASNSFTSPTVGMTTTGMASATTYYVWVRSVCSATEKGAWSNMATFSTLCNATNVPYEMNFNNATVPALPACGIVANGGTGNNWTTAAAPTDSSGFNTQVLRYAYHTSQAANAWFFTQGINMTAGTTYYISYKYGNNSTITFEEKMKVVVGNGASPSAMLPANGGTQIADYPSIMTGAAVPVNNLTFTPTTSGVYYVGFHAYSNADEYYLYLDDIKVTATALSTSEIKANAKDVRVYPNPFTDVINISDAKDLRSVSVIDASGRMVKTIASPQAQIRLGDLKSGLYILKLDYKDGTVKTVKVIKK